MRDSNYAVIQAQITHQFSDEMTHSTKHTLEVPITCLDSGSASVVEVAYSDAMPNLPDKILGFLSCGGIH